MFAAHLPLGSVVMMLAGAQAISVWMAGAVARQRRDRHRLRARDRAHAVRRSRRPRMQRHRCPGEYRHGDRHARARCCWRSPSAPTRFNTWRCRDCCRRCWSTAAGCRSPRPGPSARSRSRRMRSATCRRARCCGSAFRSGASWRPAFAFVGLAAIGIFADAPPIRPGADRARGGEPRPHRPPFRASIYAAAPRDRIDLGGGARDCIGPDQPGHQSRQPQPARPRWHSPCNHSAGGGAPLLFAGVAVTGVTVALLLRGVLRRTPSLRLNAGFLDETGPLRELGPDIGIGMASARCRRPRRRCWPGAPSPRASTASSAARRRCARRSARGSPAGANIPGPCEQIVVRHHRLMQRRHLRQRRAALLGEPRQAAGSSAP